MSPVAIVTGASQGIGRATAIRLARDFKSLTLIARNSEKLAETASLVQSNGCKALVIDVDLSNPSSAENIVSRTSKNSDE
jgi:short-subunit dehydrogenase